MINRLAGGAAVEPGRRGRNHRPALGHEHGLRERSPEAPAGPRWPPRRGALSGVVGVGERRLVRGRRRGRGGRQWWGRGRGVRPLASPRRWLASAARHQRMGAASRRRPPRRLPPTDADAVPKTGDFPCGYCFSIPVEILIERSEIERGAEVWLFDCQFLGKNWGLFRGSPWFCDT